MERGLCAGVVTTSGVLLWVLASLAIKPEPWDAPASWYAYAAAIALSAIWGFVFPRKAFLWGLVVMYAQVPVMWFIDGGIGSLWVLGLILTAMMALPAVGAATIGGSIACRRSAWATSRAP